MHNKKNKGGIWNYSPAGFVAVDKFFFASRSHHKTPKSQPSKEQDTEETPVKTWQERRK
jgi:hypothetical protein